MKKTLLFAVTALILGFGTANATNYNLWVAGTQVTDVNMSNITGSGISGVVTYDPTTNTLYLNNATITSSSDRCIYRTVDSDTFRIVLTGNNVLSQTGSGDGISCVNAPLVIEGTGSMQVSVTGLNADAIWLSDQPMTVRDCSVTLNSAYRAIAASSSNPNGLNLYNCNMRLYCASQDYSPIRGFSWVDMYGCDIKTPRDAYYSRSDRNIVDNVGDTIHDTVVIERGYELYVLGNMVFQSDTAAIAMDGITGNMSYSPSTKTLTLDNITIVDTVEKYGIQTYVDSLTIKLIGSNVMTSNNFAVFDINRYTVIEGPGSLTIVCDTPTGEGIDGINAYADLMVRNCELNIFASYDAIYGTSSHRLYIDSVRLAAHTTNTDHSAIRNFASVSLAGAVIKEPAGAEYNFSTRMYEVGGTMTTDTIVIIPAYNIWVAGVQITSDNINGVTDAGITGAVTYDPVTRVLTLDNATIANTSAYDEWDGIHISEPDSVIIELIGQNSVSSTGDDGIGNETSIIIQGAGSLAISTTCTQGYGIYSSGGILIVRGGCNLDVNGVMYGINFDDGMFVDNSTVRVSCNGGTTLYGDPGALALNRSSIVQPAGAYWDNALQSVTLDGTNAYTDTILIAPAYNIWVAGTQVNVTNINGVTGPGITGTVTYDTATSVLTLNNANIIASSDDGISVYDMDGVKIELVGLNTIASSNGDGIYHKYSDLTIQGTGSLSVISTSYIGVYSNYSNLTIQGGCNINIVGSSWGLTGDAANPEENLTVNGSTLRITSMNDPALADYNTLTLNGCAIVEPTDAVWNATDHFVTTTADTTTAYIGTIVIEPTVGIATAENAEFRVYPNPASSNVNISSDENISKVEVYNANGATVMTRNANSTNVTLNVEELGDGIYAVRVYTANGTGVRRMVVKR